eukprot:4579508-Amphidinium_carterae.2
MAGQRVRARVHLGSITLWFLPILCHGVQHIHNSLPLALSKHIGTAKLSASAYTIAVLVMSIRKSKEDDLNKLKFFMDIVREVRYA